MVPLVQVTVLLPKVPAGGEVSMAMAANAGLAIKNNGAAAADTTLFSICYSFLFSLPPTIVARGLNHPLTFCFPHLAASSGISPI